MTGRERANQSALSHYTFFSEIIHNADASNSHRGPAINTAVRSAELDISLRSKEKAAQCRGESDRLLHLITPSDLLSDPYSTLSVLSCRQWLDYM